MISGKSKSTLSKIKKTQIQKTSKKQHIDINVERFYTKIKTIKY